VIIENYKKANPDKVKEIKLQRGPPRRRPPRSRRSRCRPGGHQPDPYRPGRRLRPCANKQLIELFQVRQMFPKDELTDAAKSCKTRGGRANAVVGNAGGPVFIYNRRRCRNPQDCRRVAGLGQGESEPVPLRAAREQRSGRSIMCGLPFILGDKAPMTGEGWDKAWAFMKELGKSMEYYPRARSSPPEFAQDQRWMIAGIMEWT